MLRSNNLMNKTTKQNKAQQLDAFENIVSCYEKQLIRYAARIVCNPDTAQDIVQNTFIKLFKKWDNALTPSPQLSSWLYRVTHNCAIDYIRKETRRNLLHQKHSEEIDDFTLTAYNTGFKGNNNAEKATKALQSLSSREQQLVILKIYEEKSYKEISEITGLTTSNIGYILHHAMKKMAVYLKGTQS